MDSDLGRSGENRHTVACFLFPLLEPNPASIHSEEVNKNWKKTEKKKLTMLLFNALTLCLFNRNTTTYCFKMRSDKKSSQDRWHRDCWCWGYSLSGFPARAVFIYGGKWWSTTFFLFFLDLDKVITNRASTELVSHETKRPFAFKLTAHQETGMLALPLGTMQFLSSGLIMVG